MLSFSCINNYVLVTYSEGQSSQSNHEGFYYTWPSGGCCYHVENLAWAAEHVLSKSKFSSVSISAGDALALSRRQAITLTNDDHYHTDTNETVRLCEHADNSHCILCVRFQTWTCCSMGTRDLALNSGPVVGLLSHFYPSALRAGGVLSSRSGRAGGWAGRAAAKLAEPISL